MWQMQKAEVLSSKSANLFFHSYLLQALAAMNHLIEPLKTNKKTNETKRKRNTKQANKQKQQQPNKTKQTTTTKPLFI